MGGIYISLRGSVFLNSLTFQVIQSQPPRPRVPPWPGLLLHLHQLQDEPPRDGGGVLLHPQHEGYLQGGGDQRPQAATGHQRAQEVRTGTVAARV